MSEDILKDATDFESSFNTWFRSSWQPIIDDSRARYRMEFPEKAKRESLGLSHLPSTKSTEVVDKAKESALIDYHKDVNSLSFVSLSKQDQELINRAAWLTGIWRYKTECINGFPFFTWHDSSIKAGLVDSVEAVLVRWRKESYKEKKTRYIDKVNGSEIPKEMYDLAKNTNDAMGGELPFDMLFGEEEYEDETVVLDTFWHDQLIPGKNVFWDFKAPMMNVNLGNQCLVKLRLTVDEIMSYAEKGVFDKGLKRSDVENFQGPENTDSGNIDNTKTGPTENIDLGESERVWVWIYWKKINFRWMVIFSIEGKFRLTKEYKPSDDIFFNGRKVNTLPVVIGYYDKALHENMGRSLPQVISSLEDQHRDHINNVSDIAKNLARGGRIRVSPGHDINLDQLLNGGIFEAEKEDFEFIQYNPGVMEALRADDMISNSINSLAPAGISPVNIAPKGTNKTLGVSQMIQGNTDSKHYCQLMVRNQTFLKPVMWLDAQMIMAFETDQTALAVAAEQVPGWKAPMTIHPVTKEAIIDVSVLDFNVDVRINAGLNELSNVESFGNLMQLYQACRQANVVLDPMIFAQLLASLAGFQLDRFNPQPPKTPEPKPRLDSKLTVSAGWLDLPQEAQMILMEIWQKGEFATDTKIDAQMNEMMHNNAAQPSAVRSPDMTQGPAAAGMSAGGQIGGQGGY